jgi:monothiol glutaredoxin
MLKAYGVESFNLSTSSIPIRQGIRTTPIGRRYRSSRQGEFVGGSDIMREMYESGELQQLLSKQTA